jgi:hypothetical protein
MTHATFRSAAEHIARTGTITPHQLAAWQAAWERATTEQRQEFTDLWRAEGSPAAPAAYPNTWAGVSAAAKLVGAKYPDLVAAQWGLESGFGKKVSGRHNYFGLKGKGTTKKTTEFINGARVHIEADFIDFSDLLACVRYLVERWYLDFKGYKGCNHAPTRDDAARWLAKDGYATDPAYAAKLIRLMGVRAPERVIAVTAVQQQVSHGNPLQAPWYGQLDSATDQARRMCFSSSCAMLLQYLKPGTLKGPNGDDQYLARVRQFGDTTDSAAQIKALAIYGIKARFVQNASFATLEQQITRGIPVPCGYLHRGPVTKPAGGGHWLIVVGFTKDHLIVHDPFGEADLVSGNTLSSVARFASYSRKNFGRRWMVEGAGTGWAVIAER